MRNIGSGSRSAYSAHFWHLTCYYIVPKVYPYGILFVIPLLIYETILLYQPAALLLCSTQRPECTGYRKHFQEQKNRFALYLWTKQFTFRRSGKPCFSHQLATV